jgi:hypothetical protein
MFIACLIILLPNLANAMPVVNVGGPANTPPVVTTGTYTQQIAEIGDWIYQTLIEHGATTTQAQDYENQWTQYANQNYVSLSQTPISELYLGWFLSATDFQALLGQDLSSGPEAAANLGQATTNAVPQLSPANLISSSIWSTLSSHNLWVRVGEAVVALILLDVGLKSFTGTSAIEVTMKQAKKVAK